MTDEAQPAAAGRVVDIGAYRAWLFDLDGVLTKTAQVHAAAWKTTFDAFLNEEATRTGRTFAPFDPVADYDRYVDGEPRADGVRSFLAARGITLPEGSDGDPADARTITAVGDRKNAQVQALLKSTGVAVYEGAIQFVKTLRALGILTGVVSASENTAAALDAAGIAGLFQVRIDGRAVKERHLPASRHPTATSKPPRRSASRLVTRSSSKTPWPGSKPAGLVASASSSASTIMTTPGCCAATALTLSSSTSSSCSTDPLLRTEPGCGEPGRLARPGRFRQRMRK